MPTTATRPATAPLAPAAPTSFDEKLVLAVAAIDIRTETAPFNLADVIRAVPNGHQATPVAALLHRAQARVLQPDGWSREAGSSGCGGTCLINAIIAEAHSHREESEAHLILRQVVGGGDPIPQLNRRLRNASEAAQVLGHAAQLAEQTR